MAVARSPISAEIRATLAIAAPLAGANLATQAMQLTNAVIVGYLGAVPLAAAGLGAVLYSTLLMLCQGVLTAVAPLAAHAIGADDHPTAGRVAGAGLIIAAILAAPVVVILTAIPDLLVALGYDTELAAEIGRFLRAIRWGAPAFLGFAVLRFLLVAAFRTRIIMAVPLSAVPVNAVLTWALVFGYFGAPAMGSAGAGCATAIVQWATLLCFALYTLTAARHLPVRVAVRVLAEIPRILRLGLPIGASIGLEIGVFVTTGVMMGLLGADALSAHQMVFNIVGFLFMVPLGIAQATTVRVAFQLGQGDPAAARCAGFAAVAIGALFMVATAILLVTAPRLLAGLYLDLADPANGPVVAIAVQLFAIAALFQVFDGVQVIAAGALRGYRDTAVPMVIAAVGFWAVGFAGSWLMGFSLGLGPLGLWLGLALGLGVVATGLTLRLKFRAQARLNPSLAASSAVDRPAAA
jgi:MATE family multidrug resistance protein